MLSIDRRGFVAGLAGAGLAGGGVRAQTAASPASPAAAQPRFGFEDVTRRARDLSTAPLAPFPPLPDALTRLDPGLARKIRFRAERSFLKSSRFRLQPLHVDPARGRPVTVNLIRDGIATPIPYAANLFDFGAVKLDKTLPLNLGFAGFRLQFPLNDPDRFNNAIVLTGSSLFRFLGRGQRAGAQLRALSVNAGQSNEEFPFFREFWIETPDQNADRATIYALLDGDSVTGAFRFEIAPGVDSELAVSATLFPRRIGGVLGFAPIGSMFLNGADQRIASGEFRPEIHSSDGLGLHTGGGEWLWRPLRNPSASQAFAFLDSNPRGFGLIQREREFDLYQDLGRAYERRPSYWVEPVGDWGEGRVELNESPAADRASTNIHCAWISRGDHEPGKPIQIAYRISACLTPRSESATGRAVNTFQSSADGGARRFQIDFSGGELAYFSQDPSTVEVVATASNGESRGATLAPNPHIKGFRATVDVATGPAQTADIRVFLRARGRALTETWTMPWTG